MSHSPVVSVETCYWSNIGAEPFGSVSHLQPTKEKYWNKYPRSSLTSPSPKRSISSVPLLTSFWLWNPSSWFYLSWVFLDLVHQPCSWNSYLPSVDDVCSLSSQVFSLENIPLLIDILLVSREDLSLLPSVPSTVLLLGLVLKLVLSATLIGFDS